MLSIQENLNNQNVVLTEDDMWVPKKIPHDTQTQILLFVLNKFKKHLPPSTKWKPLIIRFIIEDDRWGMDFFVNNKPHKVPSRAFTQKVEDEIAEILGYILSNIGFFESTPKAIFFLYQGHPKKAGDLEAIQMVFAK